MCCPRPSPARRTIPTSEPGLRRHAVICGYGRVGRVIVDALRPHLPLLVVEQDQRVVRLLREQAWPSVTDSWDVAHADTPSGTVYTEHDARVTCDAIGSTRAAGGA